MQNIQDYHNNLAEQIIQVQSSRRRRNVNKAKIRARASQLLHNQQNEMLKQVALLTELQQILVQLQTVYDNNGYVLNHVYDCLKVVNKEMDEVLRNAQNN